MNDCLKLKVEKFAKNLCGKSTTKPRLWIHIQLVRKYSVHLAEIEGADKEVVEIAALLHDVGRCKSKENHNEFSYELAKPFLESTNLSEEKKKLILKCILKHSRKFSMEENEIEVKVVQSADAVGRFFDEEDQKINREKRTKQEMLNLLDGTFKKINLESAKKMVLPQIKKLKTLLN